MGVDLRLVGIYVKGQLSNKFPPWRGQLAPGGVVSSWPASTPRCQSVLQYRTFIKMIGTVRPLNSRLEYPAICKPDLSDTELSILPRTGFPAAVPTQLMATLSFQMFKPETCTVIHGFSKARTHI